MTYSYRQTNLVCVTPQYTVVPEEVFTDKQKTDLLSFTFSAPENKCLHNLLTREAAEVVFGMDEEVYEFCSRSLINPSFIHHMTPQLALWKQVGMDQERDQLHIYGGVSLRNSITTTLRNYIQYISPAEIPSDAYLLGAEVVQAPLDLIALSVCEL